MCLETPDKLVSQPNFDIAVAYRIYPRVSGQPLFDFADKLELVRLNLRTFKEAIGNIKIKLWVFLDNCPSSYAELVQQLFSAESFELIRLNGEGNWATFCRQIDVLSKQSCAELVYFAEDDYIYLPAALERGVEYLRKHPEADFLSLADHGDYYTKQVHRSKAEKYVEGGSTWRQVTSTCLTFMARTHVLRQTAEVFRTFGRGNSDVGIWLALTKHGIFNPLSPFLMLGDGKFVAASHVLAWVYGWRQILGQRRYTLWAPMPSLATHMESAGVAPGVDWNAVRSRLKDQVRPSS